MPKYELMAQISDAIREFDIDRAKELSEKAIKSNIPAFEIVMHGLSPGLREVGERYEKGDYFLSELLLAAEAAKTVLEVVRPHFEADRAGKPGKILIATVEGDLHDIGKNLVATLARASGFEVHDLGADVSPEKITEKTSELKPDVLGMSSLLSTTVPKFKETVDALTKKGLRQRVKVIIGGVSATQTIANEYQIDGYASDAVAGVNRISEWLADKQSNSARAP